MSTRIHSNTNGLIFLILPPPPPPPPTVARLSQQIKQFSAFEFEQKLRSIDSTD